MWGAKRVLKVKRARDERFAGCPGYDTSGCLGEAGGAGVPCGYRLEIKNDCKQCPLSPLFGLTRQGLLDAHSPLAGTQCSRRCGHTIRSCRFRRQVLNWDELVAYYGSTTQARTEVERAHIDDMKRIGELRFAQGFKDNPCARRCVVF